MEPLLEKELNCPYCGERITVFINPEEVGEKYIEDCQVCCKPIVLLAQLNEGGYLEVAAYDENEVV